MTFSKSPLTPHFSFYHQKIVNAEFNLMVRLANKKNVSMLIVYANLDYFGLKLKQSEVIQHKKREMLKN